MPFKKKQKQQQQKRKRENRRSVRSLQFSLATFTTKENLQREFVAHVLLAAAELRRVDGDKQGLDAATLRALNQLARDFAVMVDIELEELHLPRVLA